MYLWQVTIQQVYSTIVDTATTTFAENEILPVIFLND